MGVPTPTKSDGSGGPGDSGRDGGNSLRTAVQKIPTPTANDAKNATLPMACKTWDTVAGHLKREGESGVLNPGFSEWLMGWPVGWTSERPVGSLEEWETKNPWAIEPPPMTVDSSPGKTKRLQAIGNGQVPLCAAAAFLTLVQSSL